MINETIKSLANIETIAFKNQIKCFLSNETDSLDAYLEIHAGAGGTESQDWAQMLRRMYMKWANDKKYNVEIISEHKGDEAGIKSSTLKIKGDYIYGFLKSESGIHRLVRISPFDSGARRHTSFASVWVYPVVDDKINIEILDKDLRIDTYRSSGAGGQHVNTTDSAVRITHLPSKIVVQCQNERSQHKNKDTCFKMLKARLYEHETQKREKELVEALHSLPALLTEVLELNEEIASVARRFVEKTNALFLGRGVMYPVALEGALKLKEISYVHAEGYAAGELKHGPLALVDKNMPIVAIAPRDELIQKLKSNLKEVEARGGELIVFAEDEENFTDQSATTIIKMPKAHPTLASS